MESSNSFQGKRHLSFLRTLDPQTILRCDGPRRIDSIIQPCHVIEVNLGEGSRALVSPGDYKLAKLLDSKHTIREGYISRDCYINHLRFEREMSLQTATDLAQRLDFKYEYCPHSSETR